MHRRQIGGGHWRVIDGKGRGLIAVRALVGPVIGPNDVVVGHPVGQPRVCVIARRIARDRGHQAVRPAAGQRAVNALLGDIHAGGWRPVQDD